MAVPDSLDLSRQRDTLIALLRRTIPDQRVVDAIAKVPREHFVTPDQQRFAYEDRPLPIGHGQTTSQPTMIAIMLAEMSLKGGEKVLEVGAGCGYQTALLAELAREVIGVELVRPLADHASRTLADLGYANARIEVSGDEIGWPQGAPYHAIVVAAASPRIPASLVHQLAMGGRLVIPVGDRSGQQLLVAEKGPEGVAVRREGACSFVPLLGKEAFNEPI